VIPSYHDRLKERARTSAEIEDEKRRMDQAPTIEDLAARLDAQEQQSLDVQDHLGFRDELVPIDDGTPPSAPQNVVVTPFMRGLEVSWGDPPPEDVVEKARIVATPRGNPAGLKAAEVPRLGGAVADLAGGVVHDLSVVFVDRWGHESAPAAATGTPQRTAAEEIDLDQLAMNERIQGMLPNVNLAPIGNSEKFAEGVVRGVALAAGQNANVLPFEECEFENWDAGQAWPPPGITAGFSTGTSAAVVRIAGRKWLRISTGSIAGDNAAIPFGDWRARGVFVGQTYIASCYVRSAGSNPQVRLAVQHASDLSGSDVAQAAVGDYKTLTGTGEHRVFVKFTATRPYVRFRLLCPNGGVNIDASRFQLEAVAQAQSEPGPYTIPAATFGAMSGYLLATMDLAAVNAVIGDAAIDSAKIKRLVVDKLDAGTFSAGAITLAGGGSLRAGRTVLNASGVSLPAGPAYESASSNIDYKISVAGGWAALGYYQDSTTTYGAVRGPLLRADGNGTYRGNLDLIATLAGNFAASSTAHLYLDSRAPADGGPSAHVKGDLYFDNADTTILLKSPNGTLWGLWVQDNGTVMIGRNSPRVVGTQS
jgi:hypothetical protein